MTSMPLKSGPGSVAEMKDPQNAHAHRSRLGPRRPWPDRRRELLDELQRIFFDEGFAHLSVSDITSRLRISRSTFYELAPSKEELVELVIDRMFRHMGKRAREALEGAVDPADQVAAYLGAGTAAVRSGSPQFICDMEGNPRTREIYDRHLATGMKVLSGLIEEGTRSGRFRAVPSGLVMQITDAAHMRLRDPAVLDKLAMSHAEAISGLTDVLLNGIAGGSGSRVLSPAAG